MAVLQDRSAETSDQKKAAGRALNEAVQSVLREHTGPQPQVRVLLRGLMGSGKSTVARALCHLWGRAKWVNLEMSNFGASI